MELDLLNKKTTRVDSAGETIVDLLTPSIRYVSDDVVITQGFLVGEDLVMRPDLLSYAVYGNVNNWDAILKFNGISNPFSIDLGDLILVPELGWMDNQMYDAASAAKSKDIRDQYIDTSKSSGVDSKKLEYNKLVSDLFRVNKNAVFSTYSLPPNLAQPGSASVKVESTATGSKAILGPDVSKG